jgi:hypothetical protein
MYKIMPCIIGRISRYMSIVNIFILWYLHGVHRHVVRVIRCLYVNYGWRRSLSLSGMWSCEFCLWCGPSQSVTSLAIPLQLLSDHVGLPTALEMYLWPLQLPACSTWYKDLDLQSSPSSVISNQQVSLPMTSLFDLLTVKWEYKKSTNTKCMPVFFLATRFGSQRQSQLRIKNYSK